MIDHPEIAAQCRTCSACPTQYEGKTRDGRVFYFRYRHGIARLGFGSTLEEAVDNSLARDETLKLGDRLDGVISGEALNRAFASLYVTGGPRAA